MPQSTKQCSNCKRKVDELHDGIKDGVYYEELCERCVGTIGSAEFSRQYYRQYQRRHFARDLIQPGEKEFIKEYPEQARKKGYTDADFHKFG